MKRFFRALLAVVTFFLSGLYGLSCLTPLISPERWIGMGFLALGFPLLLAAMLVLLLLWAIIHRKTAIVLLLVVLCGSYHISHLAGWHSSRPLAPKAPGAIRIMGWNVQDFTTHEILFDTLNSIHRRLFRYIKQQQPDIICFQDFLEYSNVRMPSNIGILADSLGYKYYLFSNDHQEYPVWGPAYSGVAIFSKYPLQHLQRFVYQGKKVPESIITADVTINGITRRMIATHLQSMHIKYVPLKEKDPWEKSEDSLVNYGKSVRKKLDYYLPYHAEQARLVRQVIAASPYPVIFSADMNEVPASYCYRVIKGNLQDAFLQKGSGLGRTYYRISPTLRIDYLLASPGIRITQYLKDTVLLSDHYPQLIDVDW